MMRACPLCRGICRRYASGSSGLIMLRKAQTPGSHTRRGGTKYMNHAAAVRTRRTRASISHRPYVELPAQPQGTTQLKKYGRGDPEASSLSAHAKALWFHKQANVEATK